MNNKKYGVVEKYGFNLLGYLKGIFKSRKGWRSVQVDLNDLDTNEEEQ